MLKKKKQIFNEITIMKAVATVFITYFHFKWTVPKEFAPIFIGGAIGNSLFFFCSGYLLKSMSENFRGQWLIAKYFRIMPTVWMFMGVTAIWGFIISERLTTLPWVYWIWPIQYWFLSAIMVYFLVVYLLRKFPVGILIACVAVVHIVLCLLFVPKGVVSIDSGIWYGWGMWFMLFLYGKLISQHKAGSEDKIMKDSHKTISAAGYAIFSVLLFYGYKKLGEAVEMIADIQVIAVPLLLAIVVAAWRKFSLHLAPFLENTILRKPIIFLSSITLEVYVVQMVIISKIMPLIMFPLNVIISVIVVLAVAYAVHVSVVYILYRINLIIEWKRKN